MAVHLKITKRLPPGYSEGNKMYQQAGLFEAQGLARPLPLIEGLSYIPKFIDAATEEALINSIDTQPWLLDLKRRVQHYGYRYDYKARNITPDLKLGDIPSWLQSYCRKLNKDNLFETIPDQVIVNEYQPGQGISAHIDCIPCFGPIIASLSLGSACVMDFSQSKTGKKTSLLLEPGSLLVLSTDARYLWQHSIAARKTDRYNDQIIQRRRRVSLTFIAAEKTGRRCYGMEIDPIYVDTAIRRWQQYTGNHYTWYSFCKILANLSPTSYGIKDIALLGVWLNSRFDNGASLIAATINGSLIPKLLSSDSNKIDIKNKIEAIILHITNFKESDAGKINPVIGDYWLKEIFGHYAKIFGKKCGLTFIGILCKRLSKAAGDGQYTWAWRAAIEENEQNYNFLEYKDILVSALRDMLNSHFETKKGGEKFLGGLLNSNSQIEQRLAIYIISEHFGRFKNLFLSHLEKLTIISLIHENYWLLKKNFGLFSPEEQETVLTNIKNIENQNIKNQDEYGAKKLQQRLLHSIKDIDNKRAYEMYKQLVNDPKVGSIEHPDFLSYHFMRYTSTFACCV